jgi:uncharacterized protein
MVLRGHIGTPRRRPVPRWVWAGLGALIVFTVSHIGEAASFSCNAPMAPRERLICADPELSRADETLAVAYKAALAALSESGRETTREGQRQWLRYIQIVCPIGRKGGGPSNADCLKREYAARQKQLDSAVVKQGGLVIRRVDLFKAAPSAGPESGGGHPGFNTTVVSFPQIDRPRDEREEAWNKLIAEHEHRGATLASASAIASAEPDDDYDLTIDYVLGTVSPTMISLQLLIYDDAHGAHGSASDEQITWFIREGRALRAEDVFNVKQRWDEALARLVFDEAAQEAQKGGYELPFAEPSDLAGEVSDPAHWLISGRTIGVRFEINAFPHVIAVEVPWRQLREYLRSPLPFAISPD